MTTIIRVFPRRTSMTPDDALAFAGQRAWPPLFLPPAGPGRPADEVSVSVAFTWDVELGHELVEAWQAHYPVVRIGGPAIAGDYPDDFTPGLYVKHGVTFTSRGCIRHCPWCLVPQMEGELRTIQEFAPGWIIQDNNFLACPRRHRHRVYEMLRGQRKAAKFAGGLDTRLITPAIADELRGLRISEMFLAADTQSSLSSLARAVELLRGFKRHVLRCYVMIGYDGETIEEATERLEAVWNIGCLPFVQLFQPPDRFVHYSQEWKQIARTWSRPAAMIALHN